MKNGIFLVLIVTGLAGGCAGESYLLPSFPATGPAKSAGETTSKARPPVIAGQVNESNAHDKLEALNQELDRELKVK